MITGAASGHGHSTFCVILTQIYLLLTLLPKSVCCYLLAQYISLELETRSFSYKLNFPLMRSATSASTLQRQNFTAENLALHAVMVVSARC